MLGHVAYRAANRVTLLAWWEVLKLTLDRLNAPSTDDASRTETRVLGAEQMRPYVGGELTDTFVSAAAENGDRCVACFEDSRWVSYSWFSTRPTRLVELHPDLALCFDPSYQYMYNSFTLPSHRGRRLHGQGMAVALETFAAEGSKGLLFYVDSTNFASLRSCERLGSERVGRVMIARIGGRHLLHSSVGCKPYDFRVERRPLGGA